MCSCFHNTNKTTRVVIFFFKATYEKSMPILFSIFRCLKLQIFRTASNFPVSKNRKNPPGSTEPLGSHRVKQCAHMHSTGTCVGSRCRWRNEQSVSTGSKMARLKKNSSRKGGTKTAGVILFYFGTSHKQALCKRATGSMSHLPAGPHSLTAKTSSAGSDSIQWFSLLSNRFGQDL